MHPDSACKPEQFGLARNSLTKACTKALYATVASSMLISFSATAQQQLESVVVTAAGFEQDVTSAPASITVITRQELEQKQITNLGDALREIEGVDVEENDARSNKTGGLTISMRGMPSRYTLILIDGRRQNTAGTIAPNAFVDSDTAFIPPVAAIERIEVVRGPMSTLYGSDAMGGVVNIITRKAGNEWDGSVTLEGTLQGDSDFSNQRAISAYAGGALVEDLLSLQVYGKMWHREESSISWPGQSTREGDLRTMGQRPVKADVDTFGAKLTLTPDEHNDFILGFDATRQDYNNNQGQLGRLGSGRGYDNSLAFERDQVFVAHTGRMDIGTVETSLMRNTTETKGRLHPDDNANLGVSKDDPRTLKAVNTILDTKLVMPLGDHVVSVGGQWWNANMTDGLAPARYKNRQWGLFAEDEWFIRDDLSLTGGLRYDNHDEFGGQFTPRIYAVWSATDEWTLKGGVGKGYKTPWLEQIASGIIGFGDQGTVPLFGNPNLKPERSTNYELSAVYDNYSNLTAQGTLFYTDVKDLIERPTGATIVQFDNIGKAVIRGVELSSAYRLAPDWTLAANYTYTDSEIKSERGRGNPLGDTPDHMLNAKLSWQATQKLSTYVSAEYRSSRFRHPSFHEPANGGSAQGAKDALGDFKSYSLFHLGGSYQITNNVSLNARVHNLLDKNFNDYRPYNRVDNGQLAYSNVYNSIIDSRSLWLSLTARF